MKTIPLSQGKVALVDDEDFVRVSQHKWHYEFHPGKYRSREYVARTIFLRRENGKKKNRIERLHRFILQAKPGQIIDHINNNGLDNRRDNLRFVTASQNQWNKRSKKGSSQYKGVYWYKNQHKWKAAVRSNRREIYAGYFHNEIDAAKAYDTWATKLFGDFALLNFPLSSDKKT